jgi:hypothetical protein
MIRRYVGSKSSIIIPNEFETLLVCGESIFSLNNTPRKILEIPLFLAHFLIYEKRRFCARHVRLSVRDFTFCALYHSLQ